MNILLDAYFDANYGDDIFVETITGLFPACKFYSFLEYYPKHICDWAEQIPNLYLLPECDVFLQKNMFDAYVCVGGDIFPDKGDYTKRKSYVQSVKQGNGLVAFLGFSLFHEYCEETQKDISELMSSADIVAPRDELSVSILKQLIPGKEIASMADLAFSSQWPEGAKKTGAESNILGISVRRPNYADDNSMEEYCCELAQIITSYLQENETGKVRMFSLSDGSPADAEVTEEILGKLSDKNRIEHLVYNGNSTEMKQAISECDMMICTRLHAMISCIAMQVPFMPIVYEVKMEHILKEIGYTGPVFTFGKLQGMREAWGTAKCILWDEARATMYLGRTKRIVEKLQSLLSLSKDARPIRKTDKSGPTCQEKEYGRQQAAEVEKKNTELAEMAEKITAQQASLEECQGTIAQYLKTIEESNQKNAEYFKLIEELNQNYSRLEQTLQGEISRLVEEKNQLAGEIERLVGEVQQLVRERDSKEEMLQKVRPYFTSRVGMPMTKVTRALVRSEEVKTNWDEIQQYFAQENRAE